MLAFDEEKQIRQLIEMYRRGFEEILRIIVEKEAKGQWTQYWRDLLLEVRAILQQLDEYADTWIEQTIGQVYSQAAAQTAVFVIGLGKVSAANPAFAQVHQRAIDVLAQNLAGNLRDATQYVGRQTEDVFRRVQLEQAARKYAAGATIEDMKKKVIQQLLDQGQTAFKDKLGRKWRLDTYAEMVARTITREAASVATINTCKEFGLDLVQVTTHYPTCHLCAPLQGKVFSLSGKDRRYPKYGENEARIPRHPNCRHSIHPYVRELDDNAEETERFSNEPLDKDPRNEAEKRAYAEMRDAVTIATNRRRAREVLLSENMPMIEKVKAAEKLRQSYEKTGTKPVGADASLIKQYKEYLDSLKLGKVVDIDEKTGIITVEGNKLPTNTFPYATIDLKHPKHKIIVRRRFYDGEGSAKIDIDLTDHGLPKSHPIVPHAHDWINGKRSEKMRELTAKEKEQINDVWGDKK
jgi:hypothetical protein